MFERDYLMKMLSNLIQAMVRSMTVAVREENPYVAARSIEAAIGSAVDMDAIMFLSLAPESMATMMSISSMDANGGAYIARSLALASAYNRAAGDEDLADFRMAQARAVAEAYGHDLGEMDLSGDEPLGDTTSAMEAYLAAEQGFPLEEA